MSKNWTINQIDRALRERDFNYLTDLIRQPDLAPEVRDHLAKVVLGLLTGDIKRPAHRPTRKKTQEEAKGIAKQVLVLHRLHPGWEKLSAAVKQVAQKRECSESKVWSALSSHYRFAVKYLDCLFDEMLDVDLGEFADDEVTDNEVEAEEPDEDWADYFDNHSN